MKMALKGHVAVVKMLLAGGAHVNIQSGPGMTALMKASYGGHPKVVKMLLAQGADVNYQTEGGYTALTQAQHGPGVYPTGKHKEVIQLLKAAGAK